MKIYEQWGGQPYFPISRYYKKRFGQKVYKITVSVARTCPHREWQRDGKGCVFCDEWGSAGHHLMEVGSLDEQIISNREKLKKRYKVDSFLVYFQPYTNTYNDLTKLDENLKTALEHDQVIGLVLGTRPDCLPEEVLSVFEKYHQQSYLSVELGVQSFFDAQLEFLNRRHTVDQSLDAIHRLSRLVNVDIGLHLMFGLPGETEQRIVETAELINTLPVANVKLHNLHVLTNTALEELYKEGKFLPIELESYAQRVIRFLTHLSPNIAVQRLAAVAARWDELIAPRWSKERMRPTQYIIKEMKNNAFYQGMYSQNGPNELA